MPFAWAKKTTLFGEVKFDNMFFPEGIQLSRKERLGLIWLASNYDPEKYKKIIPARDCEGANIVQICNAIINPSCPHALRLSAQLLLGTVRVYRTKARLVLQLAEQVMLKLSSLLKNSSTRNIDLNVFGAARSDAITIADGVFSIIDYSLEPVYYDPQMIMHMNEDDLLFVNGNTPLSSPIKIEKQNKQTTPQKSPLVVSNRQISISEDLLSPSRLKFITEEEEEEFGLNQFGPAQDNFLEELNLIDDLGIALPPVFEDEIEQERFDMGEVDSKKRRLYGESLDELGHPEKELDDEESLNKVLQDIINMDLPPLPNERIDQLNIQMMGVSDMDVAEEGFANIEEIPESISTEPQVPPETTALGKPIDWEEQLDTPADAIVLIPIPSQPKRKRKLQVDRVTRQQSEDIRNNLANPEDLIRTPISAGTILSGARELMCDPIMGDISYNKRLKFWLDHNTKVKSRNPPIGTIIPPMSTDSDEKQLEEILGSPELARRHDDTPSTIGIQRDGLASFQSIERSAGSTLLINQTPQDDATSRGSFEHVIDFNVDNENFSSFKQAEMKMSPRMSGIGDLPDIVEVDFSGVPGLDAILEDEDKTIMGEDVRHERLISHEYEGDISLPFTVGDDDEHFPKNLDKYRKRIFSEFSQSNRFNFWDSFPVESTKRRDAVLAFYTCLNLNKNNYIVMEQNEVFGPIILSRKNT